MCVCFLLLLRSATWETFSPTIGRVVLANYRNNCAPLGGGGVATVNPSLQLNFAFTAPQQPKQQHGDDSQSADAKDADQSEARPSVTSPSISPDEAIVGAARQRTTSSSLMKRLATRTGPGNGKRKVG